MTDYPYWNCEYVYHDGDVVQYNNQLCMMWQGKAVPFIEGSSVKEMVEYCKRHFTKPIPPYKEHKNILRIWLQNMKSRIFCGHRI